MESPSTTSLQPKTWRKLIDGHKAGVNKQRRIMSPRQAHLGLHNPNLSTNVMLWTSWGISKVYMEKYWAQRNTQNVFNKNTMYNLSFEEMSVADLE